MKPNPPRDVENASHQVKTALREYELARLAATTALDHAFADDAKDNLEALREAHRRESAALAEFMRLSRVLHDLVVQQGKPEPH